MPTTASTTTAEPLLLEVSSVVAVQAVAAAKGSDAGGGGFVGVDVTKAQVAGSLQQKEGVVGVAPDEEAEGDTASGGKHDAPSAEQASSGDMAIGGKSSGAGASGGPTEPTSASTTTAEQVLFGVSSVVAIEAVTAAKGSDAGEGDTVRSDAIKVQELGSRSMRSLWVWSLKKKQNMSKTMQQAGRHTGSQVDGGVVQRGRRRTTNRRACTTSLPEQRRVRHCSRRRQPEEAKQATAQPL
jgi:hypothetical protein